MSKLNKCANCGKDPKPRKFETLCMSCGMPWYMKLKTLEELANEANLRDDQMANFDPYEMGYKPLLFKGKIFYIERGMIHED